MCYYAMVSLQTGLNAIKFAYHNPNWAQWAELRTDLQASDCISPIPMHKLSFFPLSHLHPGFIQWQLIFYWISVMSHTCLEVIADDMGWLLPQLCSQVNQWRCHRCGCAQRSMQLAVRNRDRLMTNQGVASCMACKPNNRNQAMPAMSWNLPF